MAFCMLISISLTYGNLLLVFKSFLIDSFEVSKHVILSLTNNNKCVFSFPIVLLYTLEDPAHKT